MFEIDVFINLADERDRMIPGAESPVEGKLNELPVLRCTHAKFIAGASKLKLEVRRPVLDTMGRKSRGQRMVSRPVERSRVSTLGLLLVLFVVTGATNPRTDEFAVYRVSPSLGGSPRNKEH